MPFRNQPAPINYVAGLGRGAIGFTTRSDIGPARLTPEPATNFGTPPPGYVAGRGRGMGLAGAGGEPEAAAVKRKHDDDDDDDGEDYSEMNYDEFEGYGGGLWDPSVPYEKDDEEADAIWETVDKKLDSRRRSRREARLKKEIEKFRATRPKIQQQFADLKNGLAEISDAEWAAIPDIGDYSLRYKKRPERYTPAPDSLLERARMENEHVNSLDLRKLGGTSTPGIETPSMVPVSQDLTQMGEARKTVLNLKLHQASDSVTGQTVVDPKGYLTDLKSIKINTDAEIGDIKRARLLLRSVTTTNPRHAPGWIAAARLEEVAGKLVAARKIISQGCQACPENEDVWLETARLHTAEAAPAIFARAVNHCPHSVKIWLAAAQRETDVKAKKRVLRRGLEFNPSSLRLWKAAVELEEPEDARILLSRAVECVPHSVELWLALAHLETYENARKVLNRARKTIPTDPAIWISAAKLEEAHGEGEEAVLTIIRRAVKSLASHQVLIDREQWLREAENCEKCGANLTCAAIVRETIGLGLEGDSDKPGEEPSATADDRKATWMEDAQSCLARGSVRTARAILAHAASVFPGKKSIWRQIAQLEKTHGTRESLQQILSVAVTYCPRAEILWLMSAKEQWLAGNVPAAREVLTRAFQFNQNSEQIWLAAVKLENDTNEVQRACALLANARRHCGTEGVWLKSALMERQLGNTENQKSILDQALALFPKSPKLWMMRGQLEEKLCTLSTSPTPTPTTGAPSDPMVIDKDKDNSEQQENKEKEKENEKERREKEIESVREIYQKGLANCPNSVPLWQCAARWEEKAVSTAKARALLEKARLKNPNSPELWLWAVRVELRANNKKIAATLLAKALQDHPKAGILWAQAIAMEPRPRQKTKSVDALKRCDDDPYVLVAVARLFWEDRKVDKARTWFDRAVTLYGDQGDAWANFYKFEAQYGTPENQQSVIKRCVEADPHHGEMWTYVSKNPANYRLTTEQILVKVALLLDDTTALLGPPL